MLEYDDHPAARGRLILIGGAEEKRPDGRLAVLREVAAAAVQSGGPLVVCTAATGYPDEAWARYAELFGSLGAAVDVLHVRNRAEAIHPRAARLIDRAAVVFFTGGDQRRIVSLLGSSDAHDRLVERYRAGATIAGTSAGAMAMSRTMLTGGPGAASPEVTPLGLSRGMGLLPDAIVDTHFAERGRFGRLLSAVSQEPALLGVGLDEDTAVVVEGGRFRAIGRGAVYIVDGRDLTYVDAADGPLGLAAAHGARVHFLSAGGIFDLTHRRPLLPAEPDLLAALEGVGDALTVGETAG